MYFEPEPIGIAPVATRMAQELSLRGHDVSVVTSRPHYPRPEWGPTWKTQRTRRDHGEVTEVPIYPHRSSAAARIANEVTYGITHFIEAMRRPAPDVVVAVIPSLMCVPAALAYGKRRGVPVVLWLCDWVSEAALATGILRPGGRLWAARKLERAGYDAATEIVVISEAFRAPLIAQGIDPDRISHIYLGAADQPTETGASLPGRCLIIGNIGLTQNLPALVSTFQGNEALLSVGAEFRITGNGVGAEQLRSIADGRHTRMLGVLSRAELAAELAEARVGIVSQDPSMGHFNLPSKLTAYMRFGLPVVAIVNPESETARLVERSGAGWVLDSSDLDSACDRLAVLIKDEDALATAATNARRFAETNFDPATNAELFELVLRRATTRSGG